MKYYVSCTWELQADLFIEAESEEEAKSLAASEADALNIDECGDYVSNSFRYKVYDESENIIEEMD